MDDSLGKTNRRAQRITVAAVADRTSRTLRTIPMIISNGMVFLDYDTNDFVLRGQLGLNDRFDWISVGGGSMLEFLAKGTLPGLQALLN